VKFSASVGEKLEKEEEEEDEELVEAEDKGNKGELLRAAVLGGRTLIKKSCEFISGIS
jgi:hypothetical protein